MTNEERIAALEAEHKNIFHQLDELKRQTADIHELTASVKVVATETKNISIKVDDLGNRLSEVEKAPGKAFTHYKQQIVGHVMSGVIGAILGALMAAIIK